ncbi:hypothetical protein [Entomomonas moraniae]|nr:hypothetical protein [Entomomonas moraniae]
MSKREGVGLDLECWLTADLATEIQLNICILDELNNFSVDFNFNEK